MEFMIVEDDPDAAEAIEISLGIGWPEARIIVAQNGQEAIPHLAGKHLDLVLLDINLPDIDGFEITRRIREASNVPIIMISARDAEIDKVKGLELGGDDYITKPFGHMELLARIKAVFRRVNKIQSSSEEAQLHCPPLMVDFNRRQVFIDDNPVELTPTEFNLLSFLIRNQGKTIDHQTILTSVWGENYRYEMEYLKVYIRRIRNKIEPDPHHPQYILTDWGVGYRFECPTRA